MYRVPSEPVTLGLMRSGGRKSRSRLGEPESLTRPKAGRGWMI